MENGADCADRGRGCVEMKLDMKYIEERNFWVDWEIIFMTVGVVLEKRGNNRTKTI